MGKGDRMAWWFFFLMNIHARPHPVSHHHNVCVRIVGISSFTYYKDVCNFIKGTNGQECVGISMRKLRGKGKHALNGIV